MLAPRDPTSLAALAFPQFFRSGNLYLRAPQVRVEQRLGGVTVKAGIVAPIAGDAGRPTCSRRRPAPASDRSARRSKAHLGYGRGDDDGRGEAHVGVSGHYGWIKQAGS